MESIVGAVALRLARSIDFEWQQLLFDGRISRSSLNILDLTSVVLVSNILRSIDWTLLREAI